MLNWVLNTALLLQAHFQLLVSKNVFRKIEKKMMILLF